jgi:hypothetical protein
MSAAYVEQRDAVHMVAGTRDARKQGSLRRSMLIRLSGRRGSDSDYRVCYGDRLLADLISNEKDQARRA